MVNEYKLTLSAAEMQLLQAAIIELPFRVAAPLVQKINSQIQRAHDHAADKRDDMSGADPSADAFEALVNNTPIHHLNPDMTPRQNHNG